MKYAALLILCATASYADPTGDFAEFEDCIPFVADQMPDHAFLGKVTARACGPAHFDIRQSCNLTDYVLLETRADCRAADLEFWQAEVAAWEDRLPVERDPEIAEGDAFCRRYYAVDPVLVENCLTEMYFDYALRFMVKPALTDWRSRQ